MDNVIAINEQRSGADLYRMFETGQLIIDPDFQRNFVWSEATQTRFIDSIINELPIPSLCLGHDYILDQRQAIDGRQRIFTIIKFLSHNEWRLAKLDDINPEISGKLVSEIDPRYHNMVKNVMIPITLIRYNGASTEHNDYLFTIFHRLNTGGMKLNNQEIRNCIYSGTLNDALKTLSKHPTWLKLRKKESNRYENEELILRFFAFYDDLSNYTGTLAKFLNDYMSKNRNAPMDEKISLFNRTMDVLTFDLGRINKTVFESLLIGIAHNLPMGQDPRGQDPLGQDPVELYKLMRDQPCFASENLKSGLSDRLKVTERITTAINIWRGTCN